MDKGLGLVEFRIPIVIANSSIDSSLISAWWDHLSDIPEFNALVFPIRAYISTRVSDVNTGDACVMSVEFSYSLDASTAS